MRIRIFLFIIIILSLIQITILDYFKVFGVKPDLLLISVVLASLYFDLKWALVSSVLAGILKDTFSLNSFGINTFLFALWSFLIIKLSKKISLDNNFLRIVLIFIIVISNNIIIKLIFFSLGQIIPLGIFLRTTILEALYTALIVPLVFRFLKPVLYPVR